MHSSNQQYLLTMRLFGLFITCPFREATQDCPFIDIRKLDSLELKFQLAEQMAGHPNCREKVRKTHETCYRKRLQQVVKGCRRISVAPATQRTVAPLCHQTAVGRP